MQLRSSGTTRQQISKCIAFFFRVRLILCRVFLRRRYRCPFSFAGRQFEKKASGRLRFPDYSSCIVSAARALGQMLYRPDYANAMMPPAKCAVIVSQHHQAGAAVENDIKSTDTKR